MKNNKAYYESSLAQDVKDAIVKFQGGFSDNVAWSEQFWSYVKSGHPCGYIGSEGRSKRRDQIVETLLRSQGLKDEGIAFWLTSTSGRHSMDDPPKKVAEFEAYFLPWAIEAFREVVVWSHPDHRGNLTSTMELKRQIFNNPEWGVR